MPWKDHEETQNILNNRVSILITSDYLLSLPPDLVKEKDKTGSSLKQVLLEQGFSIHEHRILPNQEEDIKNWVMEQVREKIGLVLVSGGTGFGKKDKSVDALRPLFDKEIVGFGELHRRKSYEEIGEKAILSRTTAGIIEQTIIVITPGSTKASLLGLSIILSILAHLQNLLRS